MKTNKIIIAMLAGVLAMSSCKKTEQDLDPNIENNPTTENVDDKLALLSLFRDLENNGKQNFTVDVANPQLITGTQGTTIQFYANSFETMDGQSVTGSVDIQLVEVFSKSDMILMNKPTMGNTYGGQMEPLISGGEFKLMAFQNGEQVRLREYMQFNATVPAPNGTDPNMTIFYGDTTNDTLSWDQADSATLFGQGGVYEGYFDELGWINCDYFYNDPRPKTFVDVQIPDGFTNSNCVLFVSFDGLNSITTFYNYSNQVYSSAPAYQLPIGLEIHVVALAYVGGQPQAAIIPVTITNNHLEVIGSLTPTTVTQLAIDIDNLP